MQRILFCILVFIFWPLRGFAQVNFTPPLLPARTMTVFDVGSGNCVYIRCDDSFPDVLVDCGSTAHRYLHSDDVYRVIRTNTDTKKLVVMLTHADKDHVHWIPSSTNGFEIAEVHISGRLEDYPDYIQKWAKGKQVTVYKESDQPIDALHRCGAEFFIYALAVNAHGDLSNEVYRNANSLVLLAVESQSAAVILTGDVEDEGQRLALTSPNFVHYESMDSKRRVMVASHHGADTRGSNNAPWVLNTKAGVTIFSAGVRYGHPRCDVQRLYVEAAQGVTPAVSAHRQGCFTQTSGPRIVSTIGEPVYTTEDVGSLVVTFPSSPNGHPTVFCFDSAGTFDGTCAADGGPGAPRKRKRGREN